MAYRYVKNIWAALRQLVDKDVWHITDTGAPTSGTSGTGNKFAGPGSIYTNYANGATYINTNTKASPTWSLLANSANSPISIFAAGTNTSGATTSVAIAISGALTTDIVHVTWRTAAQTVAKIVAAPTTTGITVTYLDAAGTAAQTVGTAGVLQYAVIRGA